VQANLKRYRASVLKAACEGRLVPTEAELARQEGRDYEPADKLLRRILRERRARWEADTLAKMQASGKLPKDDHWKQKYKEPSAPDTSNLPPLPEGWCWANFSQVIWRLRSGSAETSGREVTDYPVLKSSAVRPEKIDFDDLIYLEESQSSNEDNFLQLDDVLVTRLSGSLEYVGVCAIVTTLPSRRIQYPDRIFCGKPAENIDGIYLSHCFSHGPLRAPMEQAAKSTAGHQRISMSDLSPFAFPLPPWNEQQRISVEIEKHLSLLENAYVMIKADLRRAERLWQAILSSAFTGQLVPQDPTDEPASALLERIRAGRVESSKKTVARRAAEKRGQR
jgi:type I restriction enzyme S subunit